MENTGRRKAKIPCPEAARLKQIPPYPGKMRAAVSHYAGCRHPYCQERWQETIMAELRLTIIDPPAGTPAGITTQYAIYLGLLSPGPGSAHGVGPLTLAPSPPPIGATGSGLTGRIRRWQLNKDQKRSG
jgi:hypothetical protein